MMLLLLAAVDKGLAGAFVGLWDKDGNAEDCSGSRTTFIQSVW